jgi:hypothetical protein
MEGKISGAIEVLKKGHRSETKTGVVINRLVRIGDAIKG